MKSQVKVNGDEI